MKNKVVLLTGMAVGYVLGTRAGREQYEKIRSQARSLWGDPRVQEQVSHVQQTVKEQVPVVQDKVGGAARKATDRSPGGDASPGTSSTTTTPRTPPTDTPATGREDLNEPGAGI